MDKNKALSAIFVLSTNLFENGDFSQGDTKGIGVYSQNFDVLPFTQGFVLRTSCFKSINLEK